MSDPTPTNNRNTKKVFVKTYGCQMNVYDSTRMLDVMGAEGYAPSDDLEDADLVILNTCHIREKAAEKVYSELGRLRQLKEKRAAAGEPMMIGVAGCVAQAEGAEMVRRAPVIDLVFGPQTYHRLPALLAEAKTRPGVVDTDFPAEDKFDHMPLEAAPRRQPTAFLTVQEGCDKFCTFCVVPYTRGAEVSRPVAAVLGEAEKLAASGVREITLLGQNVNAYHGAGPGGETWSLGRLLRQLAQIGGIERLRYTTSHPRDMDESLIEAHRDEHKLMPYLHLPVQAGSDRILKAMNRQHTAQDYERLVERIRAARPDIALSSDFIVGFPGETDADFEATLDLVRRVGYAQAFSFKYSPRPGTPGANLEEQVAEEVKSERLARLQDVLNEQQRGFNESCVGSRFDVLIEKPGKHPGDWVGRSPYLQPVHIALGGDAAANLVGAMVEVEITRAHDNSLRGELLSTQREGATAA